MNKDIGGVEGTTYLVVAYAGAGSGMGLDFVMGYTFLCVTHCLLHRNNAEFSFMVVVNDSTRCTTLRTIVWDLRLHSTLTPLPTNGHFPIDLEAVRGFLTS